MKTQAPSHGGSSPEPLCRGLREGTKEGVHTGFHGNWEASPASTRSSWLEKEIYVLIKAGEATVGRSRERWREPGAGSDTGWLPPHPGSPLPSPRVPRALCPLLLSCTVKLGRGRNSVWARCLTTPSPGREVWGGGCPCWRVDGAPERCGGSSISSSREAPSRKRGGTSPPPMPTGQLERAGGGGAWGGGGGGTASPRPPACPPSLQSSADKQSKLGIKTLPAPPSHRPAVFQTCRKHPGPCLEPPPSPRGSGRSRHVEGADHHRSQRGTTTHPGASARPGRDGQKGRPPWARVMPPCPGLP